METSVNNNYCVIMAGGVGSRLWPCSRLSKPKQFLDFLGAGRTLLQLTYDRFEKILPIEHIYVSTNQRYRDLVLEQLPMLNPNNILVEPKSRNTGPSTAWAAYHISQIDSDANLVIAPSDQLILHEDKFRFSVLKGLDFVDRTNHLLTLAIKPTRPETAYGYVQMGDEQVEEEISKVKSFTEKPQHNFAEMFVQSGEFLWNTGLFVWKAKSILETFRELRPDIVEKLNALSPNLTAESIYDVYASFPNLSLESGILERSDGIYVQACNFGWVDFGTWQAIYGAAQKDENENVVLHSRVKSYNCTRNVISIPDGKIAVLQDLDGYVVVDQGNVLMICKQGDAATVRKMVNDVQMEMGEEFL